MSISKHEVKNGVLHVVLSPQYDIAEFESVGKLLNGGGIKEVALDIHNCNYLQSKMLAELIALKKAASQIKAEMTLLNVPEHVVQMLDMTNMLGLFSLKSDYSCYELDELCNKFLDPEEAYRVSDYLAANYDDAVRQKLVGLLKMNDGILAELAILTMGRAQDHDALNIFREQLNSPYHNARHAAALVLGWVGDMESKERLYACITDADIDLAEAAAASIALLSDDEDADKLNKYLDSENHRLRIIAAQSLGLIGDEKSFNYLALRLLSENVDAVRVALVKQLSLFNKDSVREVLAKLLDDASISVKEAAASGLVRIGAGKYADVILQKVSDKDTWVGFFSTKALGGVSDKAIISKLISMYPRLEQNVKLAVIEVAGKQSDVAADFFAERLKDENEDIRKEALNALYASGSSDALKFALELYAKDPSWIVRYNAADIILENKPAGYEALLRSHLKHEDNRYVREKILSSIGE